MGTHASHSLQDEWAHHCEQLIRQGAWSHLEAQLARSPSPVAPALVTFYRARLAFARGDYSDAAVGFEAAAEQCATLGEAGRYRESLRWLVCCHSLQAHYPTAHQLLATLEQSPPTNGPSQHHDWYHPPSHRQHRPFITIRSFGRFEVWVGNARLRLTNAGTHKARLLLGALLLARADGLKSDDLQVLLWPAQGEQNQRRSLHSTIADLRKVLGQAQEQGDPLITFDPDTRHYSLRLDGQAIRWDWDHVRRLVTLPPSQAQVQLQALAHAFDLENFMGDFFTRLEKPAGLDPLAARRWETVYEMLHEWASELEAQAHHWLAPLLGDDEGSAPIGTPRDSGDHDRAANLTS